MSPISCIIKSVQSLTVSSPFIVWRSIGTTGLPKEAVAPTSSVKWYLRHGKDAGSLFPSWNYGIRIFSVEVQKSSFLPYGYILSVIFTYKF